MWLFFGLLSALLLGAYDVSKKISVEANAVIPVLWISILLSSVLLLPFLLLSRLQPGFLTDTIFFVPKLDLQAHFFVFLKALIVLASWILAYFSLKNLPITVVTPIRSTQPIWTVFGAILFWGESPSGIQLTGIAITLISFIFFSLIGRREGISFSNNKWIWFIILATLTGSISALYDKFLMGRYHHMAVLSYYTFYQALIMTLITLLLWYPNRKKSSTFDFRGSILFISIFLITSDFIYFYALSLPGSLISVLSPIRRSGVIIPFLYGALVLHDKNILPKALCLSGILLGIVLLFL